MIKFEKIYVEYESGKKVLNGINLKIEDGKSVALVSANGGGKTTLIMSAAGIIPFEGKIEIDGIQLTPKSVDIIRQKLGVIMQNPDDQLFMPTVRDDIEFGLMNMGLKREEISERSNRYAKMLGITSVMDNFSSKISGGEKRMAALAAVLAMEPNNLLLDEPTVFLDPKARRNLINKLNELSQTKLIATHDLMFAVETCEYAIIMKDGKIFCCGKPSEIFFDETLMDNADLEAIRKF